MLKDKLIKLRKEKKKTQQQVADVIGVSRPAYTAYERGTRTPDYDILQSLANYFDVTIDHLLGRSYNGQAKEELKDKKVSEDPMTNVMVDNWAIMTEEQRREALDYIEFLLHKNKK